MTRFALLAALLAADTASFAGEEPAPSSGGIQLGFSAALGIGNAGGGFGRYLDSSSSADFSAFVEKGRLRAGIGAEFGRFATRPPASVENWSSVPFYAYAGLSPWPRARLRPYVLGRVGLYQMRPFLRPERTGAAISGWQATLVPGVEIPLRGSVNLDLSLGVSYQSTDPIALGGDPAETVSSGTSWSARAGLLWRPTLPPTDPVTGAPEEVVRGPWGVRHNPGLAAGELLSALAIASIYSEYARDARWSQVAPPSWWTNLGRGFEFDGNKFDTNHLYHPWNGSLFYNTGRANGLGYWWSAATASAGSFAWECCGEVQKMSLNDFVTTTLGGIAMGEMFHRVGSAILDNRDTGVTRALREVGVLAFDTVRGINRLTSSSRLIADNPTDPWEWRPPRLGTLVLLGAQQQDPDAPGEEALTDPFVDATIEYGSVFDNVRRRPYDSFDAELQVNFTDRVRPVGLLTIRGDLAAKPIGAARDGAVAVVQYLDYFNNPAFQFGSQSVAVSLSGRRAFGSRLDLALRADVVGTILGVVDSQLAPAGQPLPEGYRRYDYGPGAGALAEARLVLDGSPLLRAYYRYHWIHVTNGTEVNGGAAHHSLSLAGARLHVPIAGGLGLGVDGEVWRRTSRRPAGIVADSERTLVQLRAYATVRLGRF